MCVCVCVREKETERERVCVRGVGTEERGREDRAGEREGTYQVAHVHGGVCVMSQKEGEKKRGEERGRRGGGEEEEERGRRRGGGEEEEERGGGGGERERGKESRRAGTERGRDGEK